MFMQRRLDPFAAAPTEMKHWLDLSLALKGVEPSLAKLVLVRASQINGCANCLYMHTKEARDEGETEARLYALNSWRESAFFSDRERAALAWTDTLTEVAVKRAPDNVYAEFAAYFTPEEQVQLTLTINVINGWNRIAVGFGLTPPAEAGRAAA
jgi:AhpD family alkylhydroperoxidase